MALIAFLRAKKTEAAKKRGGSPIPFEELSLGSLELGTSSSKLTLKGRGGHIFKGGDFIHSWSRTQPSSFGSRH